MNLGDRQVDPFAGDDTHANSSADQDDDRDKPLTLSQLSPHKRSIAQSTTVERPDNSISSSPPTLPALESMFAPGVLGKKGQAPTVSTTCRDQQVRKKDMGCVNSEGVEARSGPMAPAPTHVAASTSGGSLSTAVPTSSSAVSEMGLCSGDTTMNHPYVFAENEGDREEANEENVVDAGHTKTELSPEMISTNGCGSRPTESGSGLPTNTKKVVKGSIGTGARTRARRMSKISSSVNGGRLLRPRSVSSSASAHAEVLRASEREKRLAQVRTRKEAHRRDKRGKPEEVKKGSGGHGGDEGSSTVSELGRVSALFAGFIALSHCCSFGADYRMQ